MTSFRPMYIGKRKATGRCPSVRLSHRFSNVSARPACVVALLTPLLYDWLQLKNDARLGIKRYDIDKDVIQLYFDQVGRASFSQRYTGRFPDKTFPRQGVSPSRHFSDKTFP